MRSLVPLLLVARVFAQPINPPPSFIRGTPPGGVGSACSSSASTGYLDTSGNIIVCPVGTGIWTITAAQGPAGPAGPVGPAGPSGQDGAPGVPGYSPNTIISGGQVAWLGSLNFTASATVYQIGGTQYSAAQTNLTLTTADPSNPRIDAIVANTSSAIVVLTGTAAATPAPPAINPATQIGMTFVLVPANGTAPSGTTSTLVYDENAGPTGEWTCTKSGTPIALASTSNPYHLTKDIEATTAVNGNYAQCAAAAPFNPTTVNYLVLYLRSKAAWPKSKAIQIQPMLSTANVGSIVSITEGSFGFTTSNTTSYQQIVIPVTLFGQIASMDTLRFTVQGGSSSIGFYLDWITLQSGLPAPNTSTAMSYKGAWNSAAAYGVNDVVTSGGVLFVALASNTNSTPTSSNTNWAQLNGTAAATGSGAPVFATSPTLVTPTIGAATATSVNKVAITAPASSATITVANGKTLTASNTLTLTGTDSSSVAFGGGGTVTYTIASGASAMGTSSINANTCASTVTVSATGVLTTDAITWAANANLSGVTGYGKASTDGLIVYVYPTADNVNFAVCNGTGSSITPGAATINWRVVR